MSKHGGIKLKTKGASASLPLLCIPSLAMCKSGRKRIVSSSSQAFQFFLDVQTFYHRPARKTKSNEHILEDPANKKQKIIV